MGVKQQTLKKQKQSKREKKCQTMKAKFKEALKKVISKF